MNKALPILLLALPLALPGQIKHVVVVVDENTNFSDAYNSGNMPWMTSQINTLGALATNYYANTHPSIGNYFELITGQVLTNDDSQTPSSFPVSVDNLVRELLAHGLTWKAYCESIPNVGYTGGDTGEYAVRHCALPYLTDVQNSSTQVKNLVPFTQFATDLKNGQLPSFSFVIPNLCDDAHDCSVSQADQWLQTNIAPLFNSPTFYQDTLLIFTWDESGSDNAYGGGNVEWAAFGAGVKQGYKQSSSTVYQHQSTLRLILEELGVSTFPGDAASAPDMTEFFTATSGGDPQITSPSSATATVGTPFSYQITATNGPTSFDATGLPAGLSINTSSGLISGTPTTAGTSSVNLSATNAGGTGTATLTLTINPSATPVITSPSSATGTVGASFTYQITATNNPSRFNATGLPAGLSINTSSGLISGTPTASGTSKVALSATNASGTGTSTLTLTVSNATSPGAVTYIQGASSGNDSYATSVSAAFPGGTGSGDLIVLAISWDTSGNAQPSVSDSQGNTYALATTSNNPATYQGLAIYYAPNIKGGADTVTVALNPSAGSRRLDIQEYSGIASTNPIDVTSQNMDVNGNTATDGVTSSGATTTVSGDLIFGAATQDSGSTETISAGTGFTQRVALNNGSNNPVLTEDMVQSLAASVAATFTFSASGSYQAQMVAFKPGTSSGSSSPPVINSPHTASGTTGTAFRYQITATNSPTSFNATGLPAGLTVDTSSGVISGTPTTAGTSSITLSATNASGTGTGNLMLTINDGAVPVITSSSSTSGTVGSAFNYQITATNNPTSFGASGLPAGLSVDMSSGLISGTPTTAGTYTVTLDATNGSGTGTGSMTITISRHHRG
jgi:hypothetical protein